MMSHSLKILRFKFNITLTDFGWGNSQRSVNELGLEMFCRSLDAHPSTLPPFRNLGYTIVDRSELFNRSVIFYRSNLFNISTTH